MRVKVCKPMAGPLGVFAVDDQVDVPSDVGKRWIEDGAAKPARGAVVERAVVEPDAERAVVEPVKKKRSSKKKRASKG